MSTRSMNSQSHFGGSRSGPLRGIQLPEHEPIDMDLSLQMPGDDPIGDLAPQLRVENEEEMMHISDPDWRRYKMDAIDSDGSSRICMTATATPSGSSYQASSGPPTTLTETTRTSSSRTGWDNSDEVIQPGTPQRSSVRDSVDRQRQQQYRNGAGDEGGFHENDFEKSTATGSTGDKTPSYTVALERSPALRQFIIGIIALILLAAIALAGIICGTGGCSGGGDDDPDTAMGSSAVGAGPTLAPSTISVTPVTLAPTTEVPTTLATTEVPATEVPAPGPVDEGPVDSQLTVTEAPSDNVVVAPTTIEETTAPSMAPSGLPTTASPTTAGPTTFTPTLRPSTDSPTAPLSMGPTMVVPGLPADTIERMTDFSSPQGQALLWVQSYDNFAGLPDWRKRQLFAMATYYRAFNGQNWPYGHRLFWLDDEIDECEWASTTAQPCDLDGELQALGLLSNANLEGFMAPEVGLLTSLEELSVVNCGLPGTADTVMPPAVLESLTNLRLLSFEGNALTGTIPTTLPTLLSLTHLFLQDNAWSGPLPSEIGALSQLRQLDLSRTGLTGTVPTEWGALTRLEAAHLYDMPISGTIPSETGQLTALTHLDLRDTGLTGTIPTEWGSLKALRELRLLGTAVTGTIPEEVCNLALLTNLEADCWRIICCPQ